MAWHVVHIFLSDNLLESFSSVRITARILMTGIKRKVSLLWEVIIVSIKIVYVQQNHKLRGDVQRGLDEVHSSGQERRNAITR